MGLFGRTCKFIGKEAGSAIGKAARKSWQDDRKEVLKMLAPKTDKRKKKW